MKKQRPLISSSGVVRASHRVQRFTVKGRLPGQNEMIKAAKIGRRGGAYSSEKKKLTTSVALMALSAGLTPVEGRCFVRFLWHEPNKRRDYDNIRAGAKYILDGLVQAGIIQDDGWRCVTGLDDRFFKDKEDPRVVVQIIEWEEEPTPILSEEPA
tara:strand:+ start:681 stop:1145 length:465 start_codon:yes stop_codon:yes gene_type:complete